MRKITNATEVEDTPPIVSKRNQFTPTDEWVELAMGNFPKESTPENVRPWLLRFAETLVHSMAHHFATAAERGIMQTANLLCDPTFYETARQRRARWRKKMHEQEQEQKLDRLQRTQNPTVEQLEQQMAWCRDHIEYHAKQAASYREQLLRLQSRSGTRPQ